MTLWATLASSHIAVPSLPPLVPLMSTSSPPAPSPASPSPSPPPPAAAPPPSPPSSDIVIGVLALQGAFLEHLHSLRQLHIRCLEVRLPSDLSLIDGLILPGGESTAMALVAEREQLLAPLRQWSSCGRPMFGTCAGLILMADEVRGQKKGGQELVGGLDVAVQRNHYGTQLGSFRTSLRVPALAEVGGGEGGGRGEGSRGQDSRGEDSEAVFIRAPGILEVGQGVEVLASINKEDDDWVSQQGRKGGGEEGEVEGGGASGAAAAGGGRVSYASQHMRVVPVAVRQGSFLATTFHPELTRELRWHALFADMVRRDRRQRGSGREGQKPATAALPAGPPAASSG